MSDNKSWSSLIQRSLAYLLVICSHSLLFRFAILTYQNLTVEATEDRSKEDSGLHIEENVGTSCLLD